MKVYFGASLALFAATLFKIVTSAHSYCTDRWIAAAFIAIAVAVAGVMLRKHVKELGEVGAMALVVLVAVVVFNGVFIFLATRRCHGMGAVSYRVGGDARTTAGGDAGATG